MPTARAAVREEILHTGFAPLFNFSAGREVEIYSLDLLSYLGSLTPLTPPTLGEDS